MKPSELYSTYNHALAQVLMYTWTLSTLVAEAIGLHASSQSSTGRLSRHTHEKGVPPRAWKQCVVSPCCIGAFSSSSYFLEQIIQRTVFCTSYTFLTWSNPSTPVASPAPAPLGIHRLSIFSQEGKNLMRHWLSSGHHLGFLIFDQSYKVVKSYTSME